MTKLPKLQAAELIVPEWMEYDRTVKNFEMQYSNNSNNEEQSKEEEQIIKEDKTEL